MHTHVNSKFLNLCIGLRLDLVFVHLSRFTIYVFRVSLDQFIPVLFASVASGLVSSVPSQ